MPAKIPFFDPSESLQQKWRDSSSPTRLHAQLYVFALLIAVGLLRHYLFPSSSSSSKRHGTYGSLSAPPSDGAKDETVGEIHELFIYPIKSCAGVSVSAAELTGQGFELDRRWMVIRSTQGKVGKISLREEARLTLIQPVIDEARNTLTLQLSEAGRAQERGTGRELGESETTLRPTTAELRLWREIPGVEMYGDFADGRVAALPSGSVRKLNPSEWISEFLGYPVLLIHFDTASSTARNAFPIFKPPTDSAAWSATDRAELHRQRGIEFQDEYPLLVASLSSLTSLRDQLSSALASDDGGDGRGGRAITGIDAGKWADPAALSMARFRPNVVVKGAFGAFSEDSWERMWVLPPTFTAKTTADSAPEKGSAEEGGVEPRAMLQLVARCQRCLLTAVDPVTAEKDPSIPLKLLNRSRMRIKKVEGVQGGNGRPGPCFGMYAIPLPCNNEKDAAYGKLSKGDAIRVRWRPFESDDEPDRTHIPA